jgi:hypothetical protein
MWRKPWVISEILSLKWIIEELSKELRNQREEIELQDDEDCGTQGNRKKRKVVRL